MSCLNEVEVLIDAPSSILENKILRYDLALCVNLIFGTLMSYSKLASLEATLVRNYDRPSESQGKSVEMKLKMLMPSAQYWLYQMAKADVHICASRAILADRFLHIFRRPCIQLGYLRQIMNFILKSIYCLFFIFSVYIH